MNFLKRLFGSKENKKKETPVATERGKFMPEVQLPTDEKFTINFKKNGGKFLYCDSKEEVLEAFRNILNENAWTPNDVCCIDDNLASVFRNFQIGSRTHCYNTTLFLTRCENLVADNGSILISSNQIKESKLHDLPDNFIVFATTSQLIDNIGEGLHGIKSKNKGQIPSNITTIKHFSNQEEKDFLSYGSTSKNLYLLLLEDL